jgi:SAM-dependent methyltransferase
MMRSAMYGDALRATFPGLEPGLNDLFLLEAHQIAGLPQRAPLPELAAVLHAQPALRTCLATRCPSLAGWLDGLLAAYPARSGPDLAAAADRLLWEIADEIVYQRAPEAYDEVARRGWDPRAITDAVHVEGLTVIDVGAGTGVVAFDMAPLARVVFAVEPVARLRAFMRERAQRLHLTNLFVMDGTLDAIPLPAGSTDVLVTNRAIGWHLQAELAEIDRVLRPGGTALHLTGPVWSPADDTLGEALTGAGYAADVFGGGPGAQRRYRRVR